MRTTTTKDNNDIVIFDSMADMLAFCDDKQFKQYNKDFLGVDMQQGWDAVAPKANSPYAEGVYTIEQMIKELQDAPLPEPKDHTRKIQFNYDDGDEIDLDRLRNGQEYFRQSVRQSTAGPLEVTIITDITTSGDVDPRNVFWRGAAAIALTQILEDKGYRVELWVCRGSVPASRGIINAIKLKECSDPLDIDNLATCVSGWYYRTAIFTAAKTIHPEAVNSWKHTPTRNDLDAISNDENLIYSSGVFSYDGAISMIRAELEGIIERTE